MNTVNFMDTLSIISNVITILSLIYFICYALIFKNRSVIGFFIAKFFANLLKFGIFIFSGALIFTIFKETLSDTDTFFKDNLKKDNIYWETEYAFEHILVYTFCVSIFLTIIWMTGTFIWTGSLNEIKRFLNQLLPQNRQLSIECPKKTPYNKSNIRLSE